MPDVPRIPVEEAREKVRSGQALLVCAYEDEDKCRRIPLDDSIYLNEVRRRLPTLSNDLATAA